VLHKDIRVVNDQIPDARKKRLNILGDDEIDALYGRLRFTYEEQVQHFSLSLAEKAELEKLHSTKSKIYFLLQLGYFKARQMFFVFSSNEVEEDVKYIQERYFPDFQSIEFLCTCDFDEYHITTRFSRTGQTASLTFWY